MEPAACAPELAASAKRGKCPILVYVTRYFAGLPTDDVGDRERIMP